MTLNSDGTKPLQKEKVMIRIKPENRGKLHRSMGVPQGQPIPVIKLKKRMKTADPAEKKRIVFALNARKWNHG